MLWGGDDEVSGQGTLQGVSRRRSEAPLTLASRSVGVNFWVLGWALGWVLGWALGWALGARQGRPRGVGCCRAATTRSPDGILCRAPPDVVLKHPSSWCRDPWGFIFWALGVGY